MLVILSAFGGRLTSEPMELPWGNYQYETYHLPMNYVLPNLAFEMSDSSDVMKINVGVFTYTGKKKIITLEDVCTTEGKEKLMKMIHESLAKYTTAAPYPLPYSNAMMEVPIFSMVDSYTIPQEVMKMLKEVYVWLVAEAHFDPLSEETQKFALPLAEKMKQLNKMLKFYDEKDVPPIEPIKAVKVWSGVDPNHVNGGSFTMADLQETMKKMNENTNEMELAFGGGKEDFKWKSYKTEGLVPEPDSLYVDNIEKDLLEHLLEQQPFLSHKPHNQKLSDYINLGQTIDGGKLFIKPIEE